MANPRRTPKSALVPRHANSEELLRHYTIDTELGRGAYASVLLAQEKATGCERACKVVKTLGTSRLQPQQTFKLVKEEAQLLSDLDHPHILKLFEYVEDPRRGELVLILEYLPGGTCLELLERSHGRLSETLVARLTNQLLHAIKYCHTNGVVHRDVKPANLMLTSSGLWQNPDCKLIDFGMAARTGSELPEVLGTPAYIAPEIIGEEGGYTPMADMWSVGVTVLELLTGASPFGGGPAAANVDPDVVVERVRGFRDFSDVEAVLQSAPSPLSGRCQEAQGFARTLLQRSPTARPMAAALLRSQWMQRAAAASQAGLTSDMLRGLADLACGSSPLVMMLRLILAVRGGVPGGTLQRLGAAFLHADTDGDGKLSGHELSVAVEKAKSWWNPEVNATALVGTDALSFSEFVAACLCGTDSSLDGLIERAFGALDDDRDGRVSVSSLRAFFPDEEAIARLKLPEGCFTLEQWMRCLKPHLVSETGVNSQTNFNASTAFFKLCSSFVCTTAPRLGEDALVVEPLSER